MRHVAFAVLASVAVLSATGCGGVNNQKQANPDALTGKITHNGKPLKAITLMATAADGTPVGGTTNDEGVYTIPSPPKGKLQFQLIAPGDRKPPFPEKYTKPNGDLSVEYAGGRQTYDIDLKP